MRPTLTLPKLLLAIGVAAGSASLLGLPTGPALAQGQPGQGQPGQGQPGQEVALENLTFSFGPITYRVPKARFVGTSLSKADLESLLSASSAIPVRTRIERIEAREVVIPEIQAEVTVPGGMQTTVYRDIVIAGLGQGQVRSFQGAGGNMNAAPAMSGDFGRFAIENFDMAHAAALFLDRSGPTPPPMKRLYGSFSFDGLSMVGDGGITTKIGRMTGRDVSARQTPDGWMGLVEIMGANPDLQAAPPEIRKRAFAAVADLLDGFSFGQIEMTGLEVSGGAATGGGASRINRIAVNGAAGGRGGDLVMEGIDTVFPGGGFKLERFTVGGVSLEAMVEALRTLPADPDEDLTPAQIRKLIPFVGNVGFTGLEAMFPGATDPAGKVDTMRLSLAGTEITAGKPLEGIPTDFTLAVRNLAFTLPRVSDNDAAKQLTELGYERLDLSLAASLGYDPGRQELAIREVSLRGAEMGDAAIRAVFGNVPVDAFNPDTAIASVALLGASARSAVVSLSNGGLADRILNLNARRQGRNPEDLRREYGMTAALGIPALLGNSPAAKSVGQAVAKFIAKPSRLTIEARAKQPSGFGFADFAAAPDPVSVLDKLDVTATAD